MTQNKEWRITETDNDDGWGTEYLVEWRTGANWIPGIAFGRGQRQDAEDFVADRKDS